MKIAAETAEETRNTILDKAFIRFGRYGFGKTTMDEIAKDCNMSAGNLYRYFENKREIGEGCTRRCMQQKLELVRKIVRNHRMKPEQKLQTFSLEILEYMHHQFSNQPRLMELVSFISSERWSIVQQYMEQERSLLSEVLSEGNRSGTFNIPDVQKTAGWIQAALIKFIAPRYMDAFTLEELRNEAIGITSMLIEGVKQ